MLQRTCKKIFLFMLSMSTGGLDFWGLAGFWDGGGTLSFSLSGGRLSSRYSLHDSPHL